jgi:hypothetical protein
MGRGIVKGSQGMRRTVKRNPVIWGYGGFIALLALALLVLMDQYASSLRPLPPFVPTPDKERLFEVVQQRVPLKEGAVLKPIYVAAPEPATGIVAVYHVERDGKDLYHLIVFRHDIACGTCRDILAAALYDVQADTLVQILLLDPWEVRGKPVDTRSFLTQFIGRPAQMIFHLGDSVDGISGATFSSTGLVERLNEAAAWMTQHPITRRVASSTGLSK